MLSAVLICSMEKSLNSSSTRCQLMSRFGPSKYPSSVTILNIMTLRTIFPHIPEDFTHKSLQDYGSGRKRQERIFYPHSAADPEKSLIDRFLVRNVSCSIAKPRAAVLNKTVIPCTKPDLLDKIEPMLRRRSAPSEQVFSRRTA